MKKPVFYIVLLVIVSLAAGATIFSLFSESIDQPIAFNHRLHVQEVGFDCTDCHVYALNGVRATIPNIETCGSCHEERISDSEDDARLIQHVESQSEIPWQKVYWLPDHVYFSHRRHAGIGKIDCQVCHGDMESKEEPVTDLHVDPSMEWCMDCHARKQASNDCIVCHR